METFFDPFLIKVWEMESDFDVTFPLQDLELISSKKLVERFLLVIDVEQERVRVTTDVDYIRGQHNSEVHNEQLTQAYNDVVECSKCYVWECTESRMLKVLDVKMLKEVFVVWDDNYLFSSLEDKRRYE